MIVRRSVSADSVDPTRAELTFLIEPVDEDEEICRVTLDFGFGDELEDELVLPIARRTLDIGDLIGGEDELTNEELSSEDLYHEGLRLLLGEVPVKILIVIEYCLGCSGT